MKSPRAIILERHKAAEPELDALRQRVLATTLASTIVGDPQVHSTAEHPGFVARFWLELIWPCRGAWLGISGIWLVILAFRLVTADSARVPAAHTAARSAEMLQVLLEQRRLFAELMNPAEVEPIKPPKPFVPRPRSERQPTLIAV
jgi:hypothetical protein